MNLFLECIGTSTCIGEDGTKYRIYDDINLLDTEDAYYSIEGLHDDTPIH